jgi:hypothetical protein
MVGRGLLCRRQFLRLIAMAIPGSAPLADFNAFAKSRPGTLNYATPGTGTMAHLASELFKFAGGARKVPSSRARRSRTVADAVV